MSVKGKDGTGSPVTDAAADRDKSSHGVTGAVDMTNTTPSPVLSPTPGGRHRDTPRVAYLADDVSGGNTVQQPSTKQQWLADWQQAILNSSSTVTDAEVAVRYSAVLSVLDSQSDVSLKMYYIRASHYAILK